MADGQAVEAGGAKELPPEMLSALRISTWLYNLLLFAALGCLAFWECQKVEHVGDPGFLAPVQCWGYRFLVWLLRWTAISALVLSLARLFRGLRLFGERFLRNISRIWRIKERSPYAFFSPSSEVKRRQYRFVVLGYAALGGSLLYQANLRESDLLETLGFLLLAFIPRQLFIHGGTPAILLLGSSSRKAVNLQLSLGRYAGYSGVANLLDVWSGKGGEQAVAYLGSVYRTRTAEEERWWDSFVELAELAVVIVADCRTESPAVAREVRHLLDAGLKDKLICVVDETDQVPLFSVQPLSRKDIGAALVVSEAAALKEVENRLRGAK